jgi:hypothetical protein
MKTRQVQDKQICSDADVGQDDPPNRSRNALHGILRVCVSCSETCGSALSMSNGPKNGTHKVSTVCSPICKRTTCSLRQPDFVRSSIAAKRAVCPSNAESQAEHIGNGRIDKNKVQRGQSDLPVVTIANRCTRAVQHRARTTHARGQCRRATHHDKPEHTKANESSRYSCNKFFGQRKKKKHKSEIKQLIDTNM